MTRRKRNKRLRKHDPILMVNARLVEHKKERFFKYGSIALILLIGVLVLVMVKVGASRTAEFLFSGNEEYTIQDLDVTSDGTLPKKNILEYAKLSVGMNLFEVNLKEVRRSLKNVPMIKEAYVQRKLPDIMVVRVTQRVPLGRLGSPGARQPFYLVVDEEGVILGLSTRARNLPMITGVPIAGLTPGKQLTAQPFLDGLAVLHLCDTTRLSKRIRIAEVDVGAPDYLLVTLARGTKVYLSRKNTKTKLLKLDEILAEVDRNGQQVVSIDMTVERNFPTKLL